ncbi:MAG: glycosyltransferase [Methanobacterium sp.]|nr:glycosyltransferase [Methanobacterium sp.]
MELDISIILLTKDGGSRLEELMKSIRDQKYDGNIEIIAVDSGSKDDTVNILKKYNARVFEISPEDFHHSKTRNLGAQKSNRDILVYLTQDALPLDDYFLANLLKPLNNNFSVVYGRQIANLDAKKLDVFFYSYFYPEERKILNEKHAENPRKFYMENVFASDVCAAIKRDVWEKIRFDDDVPMSEDKDFALRVLKEGYTILYEPNAAVYHSHDYTLKSLFKRRFKDGAAFASIALEGEGNFMDRGLKYFIEQIEYFIRNKYYSNIPYALLYNFIYFISFFLGNNQRFLPGFIKNSLMKN